MGTFWQDLRYACRMLLKNPGFTTLAVITLALGIGANTAIFSVVNAVLLRPLPYPQSERMIFVLQSVRSDPKVESSFSPQVFDQIHQRNQSFDAFCALNYTSFTLNADNHPEALSGVFVSADFGRVVGSAPLRGRFFTAEEDVPGKDQVAMIGEGLWRRRFGASEQIVGRNVQLNDEPYTIIGVLPGNFNFPSPAAEVWAPLALASPKYDRQHGFLQGAARLKPSVSIEQARIDLQNVGAQLQKELPNLDRDFAVKIELIRDFFVGDLRLRLMVLLVAVTLVLLIACVNVANLVLGRATARWKEIALRSALGASRWSLLRLLLVESVLLALLGGAAGLLLAGYGVQALIAIDPAAISLGEQITLDGSVIAFTSLTAILTSVLFGLAPAWQTTKADLNQALRDDNRSTTGAKRLKLMRSALVIAEVSLSLVLLVSAGLLMKSFWKLVQVNPGFQAQNVVACRVDLPPAKYRREWQQAEFFRRTLAEVRRLPEVESAAFVTSLPFSGSRGTSSFTIDDHPMSRNDPNAPVADRHQVAPGYFKAMDIPLRDGRDFTDADDVTHPGVVIINEAAARRFWPNENPLGKRITIGMGTEVKLYGKAVSREVVGIVGNVKHEELKADFQPEMYIPAWQLPTSSMTLTVRGQGPATNLISNIDRTVQSIDPEQPIRRVQTLEAAIARSIAPQRFLATLLLLFAVLALVLAVVGIYGVMSYSVARRTQEIGIRMALGAQGRDVLRLIVEQGMTLVSIGLAIGLGAAFVVTRLLKGFLFGLGPSDPLTFIGVGILLAFVAAIACYIPARRATKVNPLVALRYE